MTPSIKLLQDTRRQKKDGSYPIKVRVTFDREQKYYKTGYSLTIEDFEKIFSDPNIRGKNKTIRDQLNRILTKADNCKAAIENFDFPLFELHFLGSNEVLPNDVFAGFESYITELERTGSPSTADAYDLTHRTIIKYLNDTGKKKKIRFGNITKALLDEFEEWLRNPKYQKGKVKSWATVGIHVRNLRRIYNRAINTGAVKKTELYPFGLDKYEIPGTVNTKRSLTFKQVNMIFYYDCSEKNALNKPYLANLDKMLFWKKMWILSYLCGGANFKDLASWKWKNYSPGKIEFVRQKTRRKTKSNIETITILLEEFAEEILLEYGSEDRDPEEYILPFYTTDMDERRKLAVSKGKNKTLNKWIKRIGKNLGFKESLSLMYARHSFATVSMNRGIDAAYISKKLGHKDIRTTGAYLDSFENEKDREYQRVLIDRDPSKYTDSNLKIA